MSLWRIAWRYLWSRALVTALTVIGVGLGAALIAGVLALRRETEKAFLKESATFDLVVGAKGSPLQLILSSVYHLDAPTGNIEYALYEKLKSDARVRAAYPVGLGDNYRGFRLVGTTADYLGLERRDPEGQGWRPALQLAEGRAFAQDFEAVVGSVVARQTGLRVGSAFVGAHGLAGGAGGEEHGEYPYTVVGILAPSGTANDRAIVTTLQSVWTVHDRQNAIRRELGGQSGEADSGPGKEPGGEAPRKPRETTAVLLQLKALGFGLWFAEEIARTTKAMAASPMHEMLRLYRQVLSPVQRALLGLAYLVVVVAGLTILTTLYQAAERRRRDIAVMRALGAHPVEIFALVLLEALFVTLLGVVGGWAAGHGAVGAAGALLQNSTGLALSGWSTDGMELLALSVVALIGVAAGLAPAAAAYRRSPVSDLSLD